MCCARCQRFHQDGAGPVTGRFGCRKLATRHASPSSRNESARSVRGRRRPGRRYQTRRVGSGRGLDRDFLRPSGAVRVGGNNHGRWNLLAYRSEEHTFELQSQSHISYAVFCLKKKKKKIKKNKIIITHIIKKNKKNKKKN